MSPRRCRTNALAPATSGVQGRAAAAPAGAAPARPVRSRATTAIRVVTRASLNRAEPTCSGRAPIALPPVRYYDQIQRKTGPNGHEEPANHLVFRPPPTPASMNLTDVHVLPTGPPGPAGGRAD